MTANPRNRDHSNTMNKGAYRRKRMVFMILVSFLIWGGVTFWNQLEKSSVKATQLDALHEQLAQAERLNGEVKRDVARLNDGEYIEQKIRAELHYAKPGERVFYVPK